MPQPPASAPPAAQLPQVKVQNLKVACPGVLPGPRFHRDLLSQVDWLFIVWVTVGRPLCPLIAELMVTAWRDPKFLKVLWWGVEVVLQDVPFA